MNNDVLNKLNAQETQELLKEIDKNYKDVNLPEIVIKYDENGEIKNKKEVEKKLKQITTIIASLWLVNASLIEKKSKRIISYSLTFFNLLKPNITVKELKEISLDTMSTQKWNDIMNKIIKERQRKIKIKQVIKGNINSLNKRLQQKVQDNYRIGLSKPQTKIQIAKEFRQNSGKAKTIAVTEVNWYKSEAQLEATKDLNITKTWIHNSIAIEPRPSHVNANGQTVRGRNTPFIVGGKKTQAPQHFNIASEDINCHCTMRIELIEEE